MRRARRAARARRCARSPRRTKRPPRWPTACRCSPHPLPRPALPGRPDPANAAAVVAIIARGVELVRSGAALALCTNPINKKALKDGAGFAFPGHTEFLAHLSGAPLPVMMLAAPALRVVPVTIHIPLADVPRGADARAARGDAPHHPRGAASPTSASPRRGSPWPGSTRTPARAARWAARRSRSSRRSLDRLARRGARRHRPALRRHAVPPGGAGALRRRGLHVPRPGADPDQDHRLRRRRQRHARPRLRAHLARPRHRLRHRRHGPRPTPRASSPRSSSPRAMGETRARGA